MRKVSSNPAIRSPESLCPIDRCSGTVGPVLLVIAIIASFVCLAHAQTVPSLGKKSASTKTAAPQVSDSSSLPVPRLNDQFATVEGRLAVIEQALNTNIDAKLAVIEQSIRDIKPTPLVTTLIPSFIALIGALAGVLIGGYVNERLQRDRLNQETKIAADKAVHENELASAKAQQDRELSEKQAKLQIGNAVIEWEFKQLSLLYGPLRALLGQSLALYGEMNRVLLKHTDSFRTIDAPDRPDGREFQIRVSQDEWSRFRTVIHIREVYGKGLGVETYFDEIVLIGGKMVQIIQQHAGYARAEENELMGIFGKYLAHFAVLKSMHDAVAAKLSSSSPEDSAIATPPSAPDVNLSAAFPHTIHDLINQGFDAITADIQQWRRRAAA